MVSDIKGLFRIYGKCNNHVIGAVLGSTFNMNMIYSAAKVP